MTSPDNAALSTLLRVFQVDALGDGQPDVGVNQLAAMAITLANLARPGSGIVTPEGRLLQIGTNLLTTGPMVTGAIIDEVVSPTRRCQDNLLSQLSRLLKENQAEDARHPERRWRLQSELKPSAGETALFGLFQEGSEMGPMIGTHANEWRKVVSTAPSMGFADLVELPRAFIAAPSLKLLEKQLTGAHLGQALVAIGLNHVTDAAKFGDLCPSLMDGLIPAGPSGECVSGRLLVTDGRGLLREIATTANDKSAWLTRLLWLVEGKAGLELPLLSEDRELVRLDKPNTRFEHAVQLGFADRFNNHDTEPQLSQYGFVKHQPRWVAFLTDMEQSLPGITMVARRLLASLVFGLRRLVEAEDIPKGLRYSIGGVEALARLLVQRMANHRATLLYSADEARRLKDKRKILTKLTNGRLNTRSIYRPLHIGADLCKELLDEMEAAKLVERNGSNWERIEGKTLPSGSVGHLQLEV